MSLEEFARSIGASWPDIVGGFMGGVAKSLMFRQGARTIDIIASLAAGALSAGYLSDLVRELTGIQSGGISFGIGLLGMAVCQALFEAARNWRLKIGGFETGAGRGAAKGDDEPGGGRIP